MAVRLHGSTLTFSNVLLMWWCLCSVFAGRSHKKPPFCDRSENESKEDPVGYLWVIKRENAPPSYFFGTIHVPYTYVWDYLPENIKRAFEQAQHIIFELDLTNPYTISALTSCQLLPHGVSLNEVLPRELYVRLKRHLDYVKYMMPAWLTDDQRGRGMYADYLFNAITSDWERKRPIWVMLMLNSLTESDIKLRDIPVLDLYLAQEAERSNKVTGAVERVEEQCGPLNGLNSSLVVFALDQTLFQYESVRAGGAQVHLTTGDLIKHYNCGDLNSVIFNQDTSQVPTLVNFTLPPDDASEAFKINEHFREELINKRNKRMGQRSDEQLLAHPNKSSFIALGVGHFLGNNTVLDEMRRRGYEIERVSVDHKIKPHKKQPRPRPATIPDLSLLRDFSSSSKRLEEEEEDNEPDEPFLGHNAFASDQGSRFRAKHNSRKKLMSLRVVPSTSSSPKRRNFNDLWVRLETPRATRAPKTVPQEKLPDDALAIQRSLRVWYGVPNSSPSAIVTPCRIVSLLTILVAMAAGRSHLPLANLGLL